MTKRWMTLLGSVLAASTACAAEPSGSDSVGHWYVVPKVGGTITDHTRDVDNSLFYGLAIGKHLNEDWSAELNLLTGRHDGKGVAPDQRIGDVSADVLRVFNRESTFAPYLTGGIGVVEDDLKPGPSRSNFLAQVGVGALVQLWENASGSSSFSLRPELKARWDANDKLDRPLDLLAGIGFQFAFGAPRPVAVASLSATPPPAPAASVAPPAPVAKPAALDSDGDGVLDDRDQCPGTPRGTAVDAAGCPLKGAITLVGVLFENNSSKLTGTSSAVLDPLATELKAHPRLRIEVQGHTDSVGSDAYNLKLSQARAQTVRDYLVSNGVPVAELTAKGYGEAQPLADNKSAEGRARNRRVVMSVLDNPGDVEIKKGGEGR
ncbi:MAG: OmpA family protein [Gammaproteobacteria bacterium]